jgi:hypothetical protein
MKNVLNAEMDHVWDGFYTGQLRQTRFPAVVDAFKGSVYDVVYTGTPPKKQLFELVSQTKDTGMTIRIAYPDAVSYSIVMNNQVVEMNNWDDVLKNYSPISQSKCGENRYIGVQNILEFYITGQCKLFIQPRNAIQTKVRMEWTLESFYSSGGTTLLIDRIAGSLGIHASTIKIVSVYEGSLIVDYNIYTPTDDTFQLQKIEETQT